MNEQVVSIQEDAPGCLLVTVQGTWEYEVSLQISDAQEILSMSCDCPYEWGDRCKHQAAALYALRDRYLGISRTLDEPPPIDLGSVLADMSRQELRSLILSMSDAFPEIATYLSLRVALLGPEREGYIRYQLLQGLKSLDHEQYGFFGDMIEKVLDRPRMIMSVLEDLHANGHRIPALEAMLILCIQVIMLMGYQEDYSWYVSSLIITWTDQITGLLESRPPLSKNDRRRLSHLLMEQLIRDGFDPEGEYRGHLVGLQMLLAGDDPLLQRKLLEYLETLQRPGGPGMRGHDRQVDDDLLLSQYRLLQELEPDELETFVHANLGNPSLRDTVLAEAMDREDFREIIALTDHLAGSLLPSHRYLDRWLAMRLLAAERTHELPIQRDCHLIRFCRGDESAFEACRGLYTSEQWEEEIPGIIARIPMAGDPEAYPRFLQSAGLDRLLLEYLAGQPEMLDTYGQGLLPEYAEELFALYEDRVMREAAHAGDRVRYKGVTSILIDLMRLGGKTRAIAIAERLVGMYPRRRAFHQELDIIIQEDMR